MSDSMRRKQMFIQEKEAKEQEYDARESITPPRMVEILIKENTGARALMAQELRSLGLSNSSINRLMAGEESRRPLSRPLEKKSPGQEREE